MAQMDPTHTIVTLVNEIQELQQEIVRLKAQREGTFTSGFLYGQAKGFELYSANAAARSASLAEAWERYAKGLALPEPIQMGPRRS